MLMNYSGETNVSGCALYIDIENMIGYCASTGGIKIMVKPICDKIKEYAPLRYRKSFGDIPQASFSTGYNFHDIRKELAFNLIDILDLPYIREHKNSADINIVLDAVDIAYQNPNITHFAFVTEDRDFVPLYNFLRSLGKIVIAVAYEEKRTSSVIRDAVDRTEYYTQLPGVKDEFLKLHLVENDNKSDEDDSFQSETETSFDVEVYADLIARAHNSLSKDGQSALGSRLQVKMCELRSDFDYVRLGFLRFKDFLKKFEQYIDIETVASGDMKITLKPNIANIALYKDQTIQHSVTVNSSNLCKDYKIYLEEKILKGSILPFEQRIKAFELLIELVTQSNSSPGSYGIPLSDLMKRISNEILTLFYTDDEFNYNLEERVSKSIYKLLLTLYYGRSFYVVPNPDDKFNPTVTGFGDNSKINSRPDAGRLSNLVLKNYISNIIISHKFTLNSEAFARLYYGDDDYQNYLIICNDLISEIIDERK